MTIAEVLRIQDEDDFIKMLPKFEASLDLHLGELDQLLRKQVLSNEVPSIERHMVAVEHFRDEVGRLNAIAKAFVEHAQSSLFTLGSKSSVLASKVTQGDKDAHVKKLSAGYKALYELLQEKIKSIDSRVNVCKILLRQTVNN